YMTEQFGENVEVKGYNGTTDALLEVATKKIDATVTDTPPAQFYKDRHAELAITGPPAARGYYVMYLRAGDERLRDELDRGRLHGPWIMRALFTLYVEVLRGTPLLLQLYVIFFLLPMLGVRLDPIVAGVLGLAINYSAYEAEIYRAGIMAIPHGQMEAALAL